MEGRQRHLAEQSSEDSDGPISAPSPKYSPTRPSRARKSYLWGCIPDTKLATIVQLVIVWGGTAVILGMIFLIIFQTPCEPGMGKAECPGWHAGSDQPAAAADDDGGIRTTTHVAKATLPKNRFWPHHDDAYLPGAGHRQNIGHGVASVTHEIQIRAKPSSTSIDLPGSVFITFTPSEVTTRPKTATTSTEDTLPPPDETSQPPVISSPTHKISENAPQPTSMTGGVGEGGGEGFDGTTTVVEVDLTTVQASGTGAAPGSTHGTKASGSSAIGVKVVLAAVLAVLVGVSLGF